MNIIRKLKISEIVPVKFTETEQKIIDLFNDKLSDLVEFIDELNTDEINYMKTDGTCIMQQDNKNDKLWVRNQGFWSVLETDFGLKYTEIQTLITGIVERAFYKKVSKPNKDYMNYISQVEIAFNKKISTPYRTFGTFSMVERAFELKLSIPNTNYLSN